MAGRDITEALPLNIGNPGTSGFWTNNAEDYDIAVGGIPFILAPTDLNPYQRETALIVKISLITLKNQVSNHLLVGGFVLNHHFMVVLVLSFMIQLQENQQAIVLPILKV